MSAILHIQNAECFISTAAEIKQFHSMISNKFLDVSQFIMKSSSHITQRYKEHPVNLHCCQTLQWHKQFLFIHLDEIIPANSLITGYLFPIQNSLPDIWRFAVLHYEECINALVIRENYSLLKLLQRIWPWIEEIVKTTILIHVNWNKVKAKEDQQGLLQGSKHQPDKYATSITRGTRGSWNLLKDSLSQGSFKMSISYSAYVCKSFFAMNLHTETPPPLERGNYLPGEHNRSWNWSCVLPMQSLAQ